MMKWSRKQQCSQKVQSQTDWTPHQTPLQTARPTAASHGPASLRQKLGFWTAEAIWTSAVADAVAEPAVPMEAWTQEPKDLLPRQQGA